MGLLCNIAGQKLPLVYISKTSSFFTELREADFLKHSSDERLWNPDRCLSLCGFKATEVRSNFRFAILNLSPSRFFFFFGMVVVKSIGCQDKFILTGEISHFFVMSNYWTRTFNYLEFLNNYFSLQVPYPNNLLRNVGRSSVLPGHYVFVVDVDMMCNRNLYQGFLGLAKQLNLFAKNNGNTIIIFYLYCCANST